MEFDILAIEPCKFLFDYKILIFSIIVMMICLIIKKKKQTKMLFFSILLTTIYYILVRINYVKKYGYMYFFETNSDFADLLGVIFLTIVLFIILFIVDRIIRRFKGGK